MNSRISTNQRKMGGRMSYKIPQYKGDWKSFNQQAFNNLLYQANEENQKLYKEAIKLHRDMLNMAAKLYGSESRQFAYLRREAPEAPPDLIQKAWNPTIRKYNKWKLEEEKRAKSRDYRQRSKATNELLQEHGYVPNQHYKPSSAISFANEVIIYDENGNPLPVRALPTGKTKTD
jgi:hypothetical protein